MGATTRWKDLNSESVEDFCDKALAPIPDDARNGSVYWKNIRCNKLYNTTQTITLNGKDIKYNVVKYRFDRMTAGDTPAEDTSIVKQGMIIVYEENENIYVIVDQNSSAKKFLRKILGYTGKNEIESWSFALSADFFVWIVNLIESSKNIIKRFFIDREKELIFKEINGIKGDTEDELNKVSAKGESLLNTLSALSFLKESKKINQLTLETSYELHTVINLVIQSNSIMITNPYHGPFETEPEDNQISKLYLVTYLEIIPFLQNAYNTALLADWDDDGHNDFKERIKTKIISRLS